MVLLGMWIVDHGWRFCTSEANSLVSLQIYMGWSSVSDIIMPVGDCCFVYEKLLCHLVFCSAYSFQVINFVTIPYPSHMLHNSSVCSCSSTVTAFFPFLLWLSLGILVFHPHFSDLQMPRESFITFTDTVSYFALLTSRLESRNCPLFCLFWSLSDKQTDAKWFCPSYFA